MKELRPCRQRCREAALYLAFGAMTTAVNALCYWLCRSVLGLPNLAAAAAAWLAAVLFAFVTNKVWVFGSRSFAGGILWRELAAFLACRIATGLLDLAIMYVAVDRLGQNEMLWKLLSNGVVIAANYAAGKVMIFRRK